MKTVAMRLQKPQKGKEMKEKINELIEACEAIENRMPEESHMIHVSDIAATLRGVLNDVPPKVKNRFYIRKNRDDWAIFRNDEEYALVVGQMSKEAAEEMLGEMLGRGNWTGEYVPSCPNPDDEETITLVDEIDFIVPRGLRELWGGE